MAKKTYFSYFKNVVIDDEKLKNIWAHFLISDIYKNNTEIFKTYFVKDGESAEELAYRFYNDKRYFWILLLSNDIKDYFYDWPMRETELRHLAGKYFDEGIETGDTVDDIFAGLSSENDDKRNIKYLNPDLLADFLYEMEKKAK